MKWFSSYFIYCPLSTVHAVPHTEVLNTGAKTNELYGLSHYGV